MKKRKNDTIFGDPTLAGKSGVVGEVRVTSKAKSDLQKCKRKKGCPMKVLTKFIAKLIWKVMLIIGAVVGAAVALNILAPDVFDALTDWLKEQRKD